MSHIYVLETLVSRDSSSCMQSEKLSNADNGKEVHVSLDAGEKCETEAPHPLHATGNGVNENR